MCNNLKITPPPLEVKCRPLLQQAARLGVQRTPHIYISLEILIKQSPPPRSQEHNKRLLF